MALDAPVRHVRRPSGAQSPGTSNCRRPRPIRWARYERPFKYSVRAMPITPSPHPGWGVPFATHRRIREPALDTHSWRAVAPPRTASRQQPKQRLRHAWWLVSGGPGPSTRRSRGGQTASWWFRAPSRNKCATGDGLSTRVARRRRCSRPHCMTNEVVLERLKAGAHYARCDRHGRGALGHLGRQQQLSAA